MRQMMMEQVGKQIGETGGNTRTRNDYRMKCELLKAYWSCMEYVVTPANQEDKYR